MFNMTAIPDHRFASAAREFLMCRGYDVTLLDDDSEIDILAIDGSVAALVSVSACEGDGFQEKPLSREEYERAMLRCAREGLIDADMEIRFDSITICVTDINRAVVRHHLCAVG